MNLKQAAARLGIHYQTAYKLVRSGALPAVRVGGSYEISEAALERYWAARAAVQRGSAGRLSSGPAAAPAGRPESREELLEEVAAATRAVTLSPDGVFATIVRGLATVIGDAAIVQIVGPDGCELTPVAFDHWEPRRRSALCAYLTSVPLAVDEGFTGRVFATGRRLFAPHLPQDVLRAGTRAEFVQHLDEIGIHSMIVVPITVADVLVGVLAAHRDCSATPFALEDLAFVEEAARLAGLAMERSRIAGAGWARRARLVEALEHGQRPGRSFGTGVELELVADADLGIMAANAAARAFLQNEPLTGAHRLVAATADPDAPSLLDRFRHGELDFHDDEITATGPDGAVRFLVQRGVARTRTLELVGIVVVASPVAPVEVRWPVPVEPARRNLDALPGRIVPHGSRTAHRA